MNSYEDHFFEKGILFMIPLDNDTKQESLVFLFCLIPFSLQTSSRIFSNLGITARSAVGNR
jgi:hypothetical protein